MQKSLKVAVVGVGRLGSVHARNLLYKIPNAELIAVCSRTMETAKAFQQQHNIPYAFDDFDKLIELPELQAIVINSHTRFHPEHITKSLARGLAVFTEKPLSDDHARAVELVQFMEQQFANQHCMVGFMKRFDPAYLEAKKYIQAGKLGKPILYRGYACDSIKIAESTLAFISDSGGIFYDFFVHDFDASRWLLESEWQPNSVHSYGDVYHFEQYKAHQDFDNASCTAQFENGTMAFYYCGRTAPQGLMVETEIIGTESILRIATNSGKNKIQIINHNGQVKEEHLMFLDRFEQAYINELQYFVDKVQAGEINNLTQPNQYDALKASEMAHLAEKNLFQQA